MLYTSELTGKSYKTIEELEKAEAELAAEKAAKEKLSAEKAARANEVTAAYEEYLAVREKAFAEIAQAEKKWTDLRDKFAEDYNGYHMTYKVENGKRSVTFGDLVEAVLRDF